MLFAPAVRAAETVRISALNVRKCVRVAVIHSALPAIYVSIVWMNSCVKTVFCAVTVPISAKTVVSSAMTARKAVVLTAADALIVWTNIVPTAVSVLTVPMRCVRTAITAVTVRRFVMTVGTTVLAAPHSVRNVGFANFVRIVLRTAITMYPTVRWTASQPADTSCLKLSSRASPVTPILVKNSPPVYSAIMF